ncbi:hypothetical protein [Neptuniibacter sp. UBA847]|uniref:hypothetical protein n=1 Tax=Neptuniibacter sp. UBA847 TaxID=1946977 RepID=UPI000C66D177|nr:hypothetical protein [Neptuniibacter sp. UBA847]MAY42266.1 hypothetical protein [Oceanospirillaceae bacterium]|tara:strand:+ start:8108 stop:9220 length:1113 start_codon:yes stop_codon:yes gene_type:complete
MNGLDTRGIADGFMKGYGFMQQQEDRKDNKERRDRLDQESRDHRAQQQSNWERSQDAVDEHRAQSQENADRSYGLQMQQSNQAEAHRAHQRGRQDKADSNTEADRVHQQNMEIIQRGYSMASQGVPFDDEFYSVVNSSPRYASLNPTHLLSPEMGKAIEQGKLVMDPNSPAQMNDPESLEAMNVVFNHDINSDRQGVPLTGRRKLVSMYPGREPGTVVGAVEMEDGRKVPMTAKRGSEEEGDNTVLQQPVGVMVQKLAAADQMRQFLLSEAGQKAVASRAQGLGFIPKGKSPEYQLVKSTEYDEFGNKSGESPAGVFEKTSGTYKSMSQQQTPAPQAELPNAAEHAGRVIRDTETGERLRSDGKNWIPAK